MERAAAEARFPTLVEVTHTLEAFVTGHRSDRDLAMRYITQRISLLKNELVAVRDRKVDAVPEITAGMRQLRLDELLEQRRDLTKEIEALDAEERRIRSVVKSV